MGRPRNNTIDASAGPFEVSRREHHATATTPSEAKRAPYHYLATYPELPAWDVVQGAHGPGDYQVTDANGGAIRRLLGPARTPTQLATVGGSSAVERQLRDELDRTRAELAEAQTVDPLDLLEQSKAAWERLDKLWGHTRAQANPGVAPAGWLDTLSKAAENAPTIIGALREVGLLKSGGLVAMSNPADPWAAVAARATACGLTAADLLSWCDDYAAEQAAGPSPAQ